MKTASQLPSTEVLDLISRLRNDMRVPEAAFHELRRAAFSGASLLELVWRAVNLDVHLDAITG